MSEITTISSEFFMSDPTISGQSERSVKDKPTKPAIFSKGVDDEEEPLYVHDTGHNKYQIHRDVLKETLTNLKPHSHVFISDLPDTHKSSLDEVIKALKILYKSPAVYDLVLKDIRDIFADVQNPPPATVGSFFLGCTGEDNFPGPLGCSPKCAASLPPTHGTPGYDTCDDLVLVYTKDGKFGSLNENKSEHAYIYIDNDGFNAFTPANIQQLRQHGVKTVSIVYGGADGSYREVTTPTALDQLPVNQKLQPQQSVQTKQDDNNTSTSTSNAAGVVILIIVIIIIILLLVALGSRYYGYSYW